MTPTVGFILVTYKSPQQIIRLIEKLNQMFDHPPMACHHDFLKSELPLDAISKNVSIVYPHLRTGWGSFTVVESMISALKLLYEANNSPNWFIFLSEADYPIKSANKIINDLTSSQYDVHMHHEEINYNAYESDWQKMCFDRYCTMKFRASFLNKKLRLYERTISLRHPWLTKPFLPFSQNLRCFAGEHWFCANRQAAEYLIEFHRSKPALANHYRRLEKFTIIPEESYYHTVLCNAPHLKVSQNHWRYIDWGWATDIAHPKTLLLEDIPKMQASSAHFARKFDFEKGVTVLDELDALVG
jgi:Core-2/I-Branching enzyme